jgi:hypothetical protein
MKNVWIAVAVIILIIILGAGGFLLMKSSKAPAMPKQTVSPTPTQAAKGNSVNGTILSLLSGGKTVSCTITYPDNKGTGTVFVSDKKFAGDFTMKDSSGKDIVGHVISDGAFIYIWSSAIPTGGIKMSLEAAKSAETNAQNNNQAVNINQNVDMNCAQWSVDNSKFIVPATVKFTDMSKFFPQAAPSGAVAPTTGAQTGTSPCDQIPAGAARTACLNAMQSSGQ